MALHFEPAGDRLEIHQTRRGLRIATWLFVLFGALGAVLTFLPHATKVTVACSRAANTCTISHSHTKDWKQPLDSITAVRLTDGALVLERQGRSPYHLCTAPRAANEAAAGVLEGFLRDPNVDAATAECTSHVGGAPIAGRIAGIAGMALIYLLLTAFLVEAHTIVDRTAGTISMRGSKWPMTRWALERPLSEVANVSARKVYTGRGQYMYLVDVVFEDGTAVRAMSPAAYRPAVLKERIAELRRFAGLPAEPDASCPPPG
jgi:hypothetical protein